MGFAALATDQVHVYEAGYCFAWAEQWPAAGFAPFRLRGTPDLQTVDAAFLHRGDLYLWTNP